MIFNRIFRSLDISCGLETLSSIYPIFLTKKDEAAFETTLNHSR
jgi:hypothetical protein